MNKNVLIISASNRRGGNSDTLCDEFLKGATESGNNVEKIFFADKEINYCKGCGICNKEKICIQNDDMTEILEKMVKADIIVMATPVYFYTMNGQLKTFIDRCVSRYTEISNKDFYLIMTAADARKETLERVVTEIKGFLECLDNPTLKGILYGTGVWAAGEIKDTKAMAEAFKMGKNI